MLHWPEKVRVPLILCGIVMMASGPSNRSWGKLYDPGCWERPWHPSSAVQVRRAAARLLPSPPAALGVPPRCTHTRSLGVCPEVLPEGPGPGTDPKAEALSVPRSSAGKFQHEPVSPYSVRLVPVPAFTHITENSFYIHILKIKTFSTKL